MDVFNLSPAERDSLIHSLFAKCGDDASIYSQLIDIGKLLPKPQNNFLPDDLIPGCQSVMHLAICEESGHYFFEMDSDALISRGMAFLVYVIYHGQDAKTILTTSLAPIERLGLFSILSPSRSNGLHSLVATLKKRILLLEKARFAPS